MWSASKPMQILGLGLNPHAAGTEEDIKSVRICCISEEIAGKRWKFTLNQRRGHGERTSWSGAERVRRERSGTLWNQESGTTDHAISRRQLLSPGKDGRAHITPPFQAVPAGKRPSPPPRSGCGSGRTAGKEPCSLPARSSSSAVAVSPLLRGFGKAELPRCYLFCKTLQIIAFVYTYTDRFCVRVRVRVCVIF